MDGQAAPVGLPIATQYFANLRQKLHGLGAHRKLDIFLRLAFLQLGLLVKGDEEIGALWLFRQNRLHIQLFGPFRCRAVENFVAGKGRCSPHR